MIAGVRVEPLFQRARCQAQRLAPRRHFDRFEIQVGDRLVPYECFDFRMISF